MSKTTIEVSNATWKDLVVLKEPGQTFDDVLRELLRQSGEATVSRVDE